jgi:hypothetical protein
MIGRSPGLSIAGAVFRGIVVSAAAADSWPDSMNAAQYLDWNKFKQQFHFAIRGALTY